MNGLNELKERNDIGKIRGAELEKKLQEVEQTIKPDLDITDRIITIIHNDHAAQPKP